jgi:hypothetical protein
LFDLLVSFVYLFPSDNFKVWRGILSEGELGGLRVLTAIIYGKGFKKWSVMGKGIGGGD